MEAAFVFQKFNTTAAEIYFNTALSVANVTWERGLLVKGTMFCHGIGGNINQFLYLGQTINFIQTNSSEAFLDQLKSAGYDLEFLKNQAFWRSKQFTLWTLNWNNLNHTRIYDSDEGYSMYAGNFAIGMTYSQLINMPDYPYGQEACQAGWNLCL